MVSRLERAEIRALGRDGVSQREIARRLGINRRVASGSGPAPRECPAPPC